MNLYRRHFIKNTFLALPVFIWAACTQQSAPKDQGKNLVSDLPEAKGAHTSVTHTTKNEVPLKHAQGLSQTTRGPQEPSATDDVPKVATETTVKPATPSPEKKAIQDAPTSAKSATPPNDPVPESKADPLPNPVLEAKVSYVSEDDVMAKALAYVADPVANPPASRVDKPGTPGEKQVCDNCQFYKISQGKPYGACQLLVGKGMVPAKGWCKSWLLKKV